MASKSHVSLVLVGCPGIVFDGPVGRNQNSRIGIWKFTGPRKNVRHVDESSSRDGGLRPKDHVSIFKRTRFTDNFIVSFERSSIFPKSIRCRI